MTIADFINSNIEVGEWLEDNSKVGKMIPFQHLKDFIERKVVIDMPRQGVDHCYKVVMIKSYQENADHTYKLKKNPKKMVSNSLLKDLSAEREDIWEIEHTYDRIGYSDDKGKKHKENSWVSEIYCSNGRFKTAHLYPECFYELAI